MSCDSRGGPGHISGRAHCYCSTASMADGRREAGIRSAASPLKVPLVDWVCGCYCCFVFLLSKKSWTCWQAPLVLALGRLRLEDHEVEANLGNIVKICLKNKQTYRQTNKTPKTTKKQGN